MNKDTNFVSADTARATTKASDYWHGSRKRVDKYILAAANMGKRTLTITEIDEHVLASLREDGYGVETHHDQRGGDHAVVKW